LTDRLNTPHGGTLIDLMSDMDKADALKDESRDWPSWDLTPRQLCDLELMLNAGFSPLKGFLTRSDYDGVLSDMRLADGALWPIPVTLDIPPSLAGQLSADSRLALRDPEGVMLAVLHVADVWEPDFDQEADTVFGTRDKDHPGVEYLHGKTNPCYVGGRIEGIEHPVHHDYSRRWKTPAELRLEFSRLGWREVIAYQTRTPIHRAERESILDAAGNAQASVLIHAITGKTLPGDLDHYTRVRCHQAILPHFPKNTAMLSLLPMAPRFGGKREALWRAVISKNYGCSHLIVGGDHSRSEGGNSVRVFYDPEDAQSLIERHRDELGVTALRFQRLSYLRDEDRFVPQNKVPDGARVLHMSQADLLERLDDGREIPEWFTYPAVADQLRKAHPSRHKQGFTVFFTGLSGAGKSTVAQVLQAKFLEMGGRPVTLLDGDIVRKHLSSELGFTREHRNLNVHRIGFVASEITKNGGIAVCAPIAPYDAVRKENRAMIEQGGGYILVHVATPVEVCEQRDRKGLYAKARAGIIKEFTGVSDPYEVPDDADVTIDATDMTAEEAAQQIILYLQREGYVGTNGH
jgi:sulfate adenylyltransferase